eukprot:768635-Hanusia_phi.AAC.8
MSDLISQAPSSHTHTHTEFPSHLQQRFRIQFLRKGAFTLVLMTFSYNPPPILTLKSSPLSAVSMFSSPTTNFHPALLCSLSLSLSSAPLPSSSPPFPQARFCAHCPSFFDLRGSPSPWSGSMVPVKNP